MSDSKSDKVFRYPTVAPQSKFNCDQSRYAESVLKPVTYKRLIACLCGIIIGMLTAVVVIDPLMLKFYGAKIGDESNTIVSTTTAFILYGVQLNLDPTSLSSNWSQCYSGTYNIPINSSLLTYILSTCYKGKLMLGCRAVGNSSLTVAATGLRADVLYNCSTISNCSHVANGVGWYYSDTWSWGFVNNTDPVIRNSCDTGTINPNHRLCWHTSPSFGGYGCGSALSLNSVTTYERVIYHAN